MKTDDTKKAIDYWQETGRPKSEYAKMMKEKILRGEY